MATTLVLGRPGAHARDLAVRRALLVAALAVAAAALAAGALVARTWWPLVPAAALVLVARDRAGWVRRALAGMRAEQAAGRAAESAGPAAVVHGALLGTGGDADHVVLGPVCAVVETKSGRGPLRTDGGTVTVGGRRLARDPGAQARAQAALVRRTTGCWTEAVVCVVGMDGPPRRVGDCWYCSAADLAQVLRRLPARLDADAARDAARRLSPG